MSRENDKENEPQNDQYLEGEENNHDVPHPAPIISPAEPSERLRNELDGDLINL